MNSKQAFYIHLEKLLKNELKPSEMIIMLVNFRAFENDTETLNRLLKKIIDNYAISEKKLFELNKVKNRFLGMAAHDLRTPLVSIRGFSEMLLDEETDPLSQEQKSLISIIHKASQDMLNLVNDLLDVSAIESGRLDLVLETVSFGKLVEERIKLYHIVSRKKKIKIEFSIEELSPVSLDTQKIIQVIDNLIGNAIKYSPENTTVMISVKTENEKLFFHIKDQGTGIPEEEQDKLFGEFQRLSVKPTGGEKSTGLGLSIAKKIAEAHQGDILVKSSPGQGSLFSLVLPYHPVSDEKCPEAESKPDPASSEEDTRQKKRKLKVLLADDERHIRVLMKKNIESMNGQVVGEAENGNQVMHMFRKKKPDILFLDINMPGKTGDDVLKDIMETDPDAFVIMLTSVSDYETVSRCIELGASGYIRKDTPSQEIKKMINQTWTEYKKNKRNTHD
ncbi:MAG: response regulator [Proteobacteria bacterium]|nr:response regulator [Pseudomonadota bacterium]